MPTAGACDFLVVTALDMEADAVKRHLEAMTLHPSGRYSVGHVARRGGTDRYVVGLAEIGGMGSAKAQAATREAIYACRPKRVILTGIAAGFPESGVRYGDVLVPDGIVSYELAKVREAAWFAWMRSVPILRLLLPRVGEKHEHRALPVQVSYLLRMAASHLAGDDNEPWWRRMTISRPDGTSATPRVHHGGDSVLGSGDKVVAASEYDGRRWLLTSFKKRAVGLEMESLGAWMACQASEKQFLVVKACQDYATGAKDATAVKDLWRDYACDAAAAFTAELISRFELPTGDLLDDHLASAEAAVREFNAAAPQPEFPYTLSLAGSQSALKREMFDEERAPLVRLMPNDAQRYIALHGGGGAGKTRLAWWVVRQALQAGLCPVLLDLRNYGIASGSPADDGEGGDPAELDRVVSANTIPRRTSRELRALAQETRLFVVVDGFNEIPRELRTRLLDHLLGLGTVGECYVLVTTRPGLPDNLRQFHHVRVDKLSEGHAQPIFDRKFGPGAFLRLPPRLRVTYQRPFFLALALRTRRRYEGAAVWRAIFEEFFEQHLGMGAAVVDQLGAAAFAASRSDGTFDLSSFCNAVAQHLAALSDAEVVTREHGFDHELWRDYLVSRHLAATRSAWRDEVFDAITTFASSLECLSLTIEHIGDSEARDAFVKAVHDWNYGAAADCVREFGDAEPPERQLSDAIIVAVLAAIAEKRFDDVERTRRRAEDILRADRSGPARNFLEADSRDDLSRRVRELAAPEAWYSTWRGLFTRASGHQFAVGDVDLIASDDSLIGWAAANLARRSRLDETAIARLIDIFNQMNIPQGRTVRWRVVHTLGAHPHPAGIALLCEAVRADPHHWVRYGAVRALVEIAARGDAALAGDVLRSLGEALDVMPPGPRWMRRQVLQEVVETAFLRGASPEWVALVRPLVEEVLRLADLRQRDELAGRIQELTKGEHGEARERHV